MRRVRTKICGITNLDDALCAADHGVDALGFVFYEKSSRYIEPAAAQEIIRRLPPFVTTVGLFVNPDPSYVNQVLSVARLQLLQFHGDETDQFCASFNHAYIKALRVAPDMDLVKAISTYRYASGILLDAFVPGKFGGTGQAFNWDLVPQDSEQAIILAGGLSAENVSAAIQRTSPYAVDVSGGVERAKGVKDQGKIKLFLETVKLSAA